HLRLYTAQLGPDRAVQAAQPLDDVDETLSRLLLILALVSAGGVALAAGLGVVVSRGALGPVARLSSVAHDVAETQDLSRRIEEGGDDELAELARSFNRMLSELESSVEAQRQLVADASHELRTPLTSIRTNVELLGRAESLGAEQRQRLITDVVEQLEELTALVGDLVDLARYAEQDEERVPLRFDHLVEDMVERARRHAPTLTFDFEAEACLVRGAQAALERATFNLLDNAAKWSPPGGRIEVRVTRQGALSVSDQGPGISEGDLPRIFDRFYRAGSARELPGSGLGLAIVRQIAEAHGGRVEASSPLGGGSELRLWIPPLPARPE
ncbi:MAG: ATP-binding protein, partial [Actinomycetota bacterium]|nr:ATP-binding protein [Actinomycetota bacterium]